VWISGWELWRVLILRGLGKVKAVGQSRDFAGGSRTNFQAAGDSQTEHFGYAGGVCERTMAADSRRELAGDADAGTHQGTGPATLKS
jgi:hypothetical protein